MNQSFLPIWARVVAWAASEIPFPFYSLWLSSLGLGKGGKNEGIKKQRSCSVTDFILVMLESAPAVFVQTGSG